MSARSPTATTRPPETSKASPVAYRSSSVRTRPSTIRSRAGPVVTASLPHLRAHETTSAHKNEILHRTRTPTATWSCRRRHENGHHACDRRVKLERRWQEPFEDAKSSVRCFRRWGGPRRDGAAGVRTEAVPLPTRVAMRHFSAAECGPASPDRAPLECAFPADRGGASLEGPVFPKGDDPVLPAGDLR